MEQRRLGEVRAGAHVRHQPVAAFEEADDDAQDVRVYVPAGQLRGRGRAGEERGKREKGKPDESLKVAQALATIRACGR
jgi:hypothetical protein